MLLLANTLATLRCYFRLRLVGRLFPLNIPKLRDGGDPELTGGEFDDFAGGVFEADLAVLGGFGPSTLNDGAVLEDVGLTGADGGDRFMVAVGHGVFFDHHGDDYAGSELF